MTALLDRLYRIDAEFGGDELCGLAAGYLQEAARVFSRTGGSAGTARMHQVMAGLTQIAGWLSIDANRHADARRYLSAAIYAAHEAGDLGLAAHAMGYLSLSALYQGNHREAFPLAETAVGLSGPASPAARAIVHTRAARAPAREGHSALGACQRHLDLAWAAFTDSASGGAPEPRWCGYVDRVELAAQRGACFLDLGMPAQAATAVSEAIGLLTGSAPHRVRDLAHYKTRLALAHLAAGDLDAVMAAGTEAGTIVSRITSSRIRERFAELTAAVGTRDPRRARELATVARGTRLTSGPGPLS
ncbi:MAG TPA: hypothetical protein VGS19_15385 [Streptosporangiaceae bacterium]|nr:hypothetical protein [Streptosporangiaceae bacterium]